MSQSQTDQLHSPQAVAIACGCGRSVVQAALPDILSALQKYGILTSLTAVGALATVNVECGFKPVHEKGGIAYFEKHYQGRMGNNNPGDGAKYSGRGFIQLTGKDNYAAYGKELGIDLLGNPNLALTIATASNILALYFKNRKVNVACDAKDWEKVRRLVNGGLNGYDTFLATVNKLLKIIE